MFEKYVYSLYLDINKSSIFSFISLDMEKQSPQRQFWIRQQTNAKVCFYAGLLPKSWLQTNANGGILNLILGFRIPPILLKTKSNVSPSFCLAQYQHIAYVYFCPQLSFGWNVDSYQPFARNPNLAPVELTHKILVGIQPLLLKGEQSQKIAFLS